ncbi:MAG: hypothetical protein QXI19_05440, partial [Candidatus Caldarchaeum sp.]
MVVVTLRNLAFVLFGCWMYLLSSALPPVLCWQDVKMVAIVGGPAVLVQYKGIKATKAEFKLNGKRAGEVSLDDRKSEGELRFSVPLMELQRGDNLVEVFLSDAEGKVLG